MASENKKYNMGGKISRYEPNHMQEINASIFLKKSFEQVGYLWFCKKVQEVGYNCDLESLFAINFRGHRATILGVEFMVLADIISSPTTIPNVGEIWFKGMDLYIEPYKSFLKPWYEESPFPYISYHIVVGKVHSLDEGYHEIIHLYQTAKPTQLLFQRPG